MGKKLFVGSLSWDTNDQGLREAFASYGEIVEATVITDRDSGRSRGFGFVTFTEDESADAAKTALDGTELDGRTIRVDVARELVDWAKKVNDLDLKGAVLDGEYYDGAAGVKRLSNFPTREEAQAKVVQLVLTPAGNVVGAATAPGSKLLAIVKEIEERLEAGKTIEKIA